MSTNIKENVANLSQVVNAQKMLRTLHALSLFFSFFACDLWCINIFKSFSPLPPLLIFLCAEYKGDEKWVSFALIKKLVNCTIDLCLLSLVE